MPDVDDRLRRDLSRLFEPVDSAGAFDAVQTKRSRRRRVRRTERLSLVVVVALVIATGGYALYRAFGGPPQPARQPAPSAVPSVTPGLSPSPSATPSQASSPPSTPAVPGYPAGCHASQVVADFDADGQFDTATIAKSRCFHHPGQEPIRTAPFDMAISWGGGAAGIVAMDGCHRACVAYRAGDLNGDGAFELWVIVDGGASSRTLEVFELPQSEAFGDAATVAPPGAVGFPAGQVAEFPLGSSASRDAAVGCAPAKGTVTAESADATGRQGEFRVHTTVLRFDPVDMVPFARFTVMSTSDRVVHVASGDIHGAFDVGAPCWTEAPPGG